MKKIFFSAIWLTSILSYGQTITFEDPKFKAELLSITLTSTNYAYDLNNNRTVVDTNNDGEIQISEAENLSKLKIGNPYPELLISSTPEISYFRNLSALSISFSNITHLNLSNFPYLEYLYFSSSNIQEINATGSNALNSLNLSGTNQYTSLFDFLQTSANITSLELSRFENITSIDLSRFPQINNVSIDEMFNLESLNIENNINLKNLSLTDTRISALDFSSNPNLESLAMNDNNEFEHLNLSNNSNLKSIILNSSPLVREIDLSNKLLLNNITLSDTGINTLNFENSPNIEYLGIARNQITTIDFRQIPNLKDGYIKEDLVETIDFSQNYWLRSYGVHGTNLKYINAKGIDPYSISLATASRNPNLRYLCTDELSIERALLMLSFDRYTNVNVNSYCTFRPGGPILEVSGYTRFDLNNNGYDESDTPVKNQMFAMADGYESGGLSGDENGFYNIAAQIGLTTITPVLENPDYFIFSPESIDVEFTGNEDPVTQNFSLQANGVKNDLEISVLPIEVARPGFEAKYKIFYKNKGNTTQSGQITFNYNDDLADFISSSVQPTNQSYGNINWSFTALKPFETKEIFLNLRLNTPTQEPALNGDDILVFNTQIEGETDQTPNDNTFTLNQLVVNSYDPNDKTCLEGSRISEAQIGDYVHYLIRFENTGSANAVNVVVADTIDTEKFDLSSLITLTSSHSVKTRINNDTNKVEFIFENIQLPFEDDTNDGYVMFKIKTKSDLVLGDQFSNTASIFFDYNFPIITNTATTIIENILNTSNLTGTSNDFTIFPNPIKDVLNIKTKETIRKIEIYDANGRIVMKSSVIDNQLNISHLKEGEYFIKIFTNKEMFTHKILKK